MPRGMLITANYRRGTTAQWVSANPVLNALEIGMEQLTSGKWLLKMGDGSTAWNSLIYAFDTGAFGSGSTLPTSLHPGDYFFLTSDKNLYSAATGSWVVVASLVGATGPTGAAGATGSTGPSGTISVTAPITNSGTSTAASLGISVASSSVAGSMSAADKSKLDAFPAYAARAFTNNPSRTIQTVAASANGFQLSSTRDASVSYSVTIATTSTIGGPQLGTVVLEICATNSATAASWQEVARSTNGQTITLAITLQSVQTSAGALGCIVPAGYCCRLRSVSTSGAPTFAFNSGQEVLL